MRLMKAVLLLVGLLPALAACGPIYDTQYTYHQPDDRRGQACTASCEADQSQCSYQCSRETQDCENERRQIAERDFRRYERYQRNNDLPVEKSEYDFMPSYSCPWESECTNVCEAEYRACFTGCGGEIEARQVCVMGCDQVK